MRTPYIETFAMTTHTGADAAHTAPKNAARLRGVVAIAAFMAFTAMTALVLRSALAFPPVPGVGPKFRYFEPRKDEFEVLFLGSSRLYHHVIPKPFDAAVSQALAKPIRSFNFGYDGMWPPESLYVLQEILRLRPQRLRWVILEVKEVDANNEVHNQNTYRMAYWHDLAHTRMAAGAVVRASKTTAERFKLLDLHWRHFFSCSLNQGRGTEILLDTLDIRRAKRRDRRQDWEDTQGYEPGSDTPMSGKFLADYHRDVERMRTAPESAISPELSAGLQAAINAIRSVGAQPVLVLTPSVDRRENLTQLPAGVPVWNFSTPDRAPELFAAELHYDGHHLNPQGATLFTQMLADRFIQDFSGGVQK